MTYYEILGVSPTASQFEIHRAYREAAKVHHPDHGGDEAMMKRLNEAYSVLRNPALRAAYDTELVVKAMAGQPRPQEATRRHTRRGWTRNQKMALYYAIMVPFVLTLLVDLWMFGLEMLQICGGRHPILLVPALVLAIVISRNLRGYVLGRLVGIRI